MVNLVPLVQRSRKPLLAVLALSVTTAAFAGDTSIVPAKGRKNPGPP